MKKNKDLFPVEPCYQPRWLNKDQAIEAVNLYHLARVPLSGTGKDTPYERMLIASKWLSDKTPGLTSTAVYKDLCGILGR